MFGNESSPLYLISVMGTKVPGNEGSWERKFQGTKVPVTPLTWLIVASKTKFNTWNRIEITNRFSGRRGINPCTLKREVNGSSNIYLKLYRLCTTTNVPCTASIKNLQ